MTTLYHSEVMEIDEHNAGIDVTYRQNDEVSHLRAQFMINCAGIYADAIIDMLKLASDVRLVPFKGIYYRLSPKFDDITRRLIYPVPDPNMPFLGVHLTRMIGGYTTVGPNAVLACGREAYEGCAFNSGELVRLIRTPGLAKLLWQYRRQGLAELKATLSKRFYASLVQKYCPSVDASDFIPYRHGIRAQAVHKHGHLVHDFCFINSERSLHVANAPSPAATSAIPIANEIIRQI